ncbi:MAG: 30S ribosomal protein S20 [Spirochaeta sp. LUC14_002_19_P3]|nr:MAG: 30S ribosomal protein S20 [Spirochaeta sp. LUC14_002_19_P3]
MPNNSDAAKRHRQNLKRRLRNRSVRSRVRTSIKSFESAVDKKDKGSAEARYFELVKFIDTAAGKGLYHRNAAARKKSRMHKKLKSLE